MGKQKFKITVSIRSIITYMLFSLCLLGCNTVYSTCITKDYRFPELTVLCLFLLLVTNVKCFTNKVIKKWLIIFIPYFLWNMAIIMFSVSLDKFISYAVRFLIFVPFLSLVILGDTRKNNIWKIALQFENIVCVYAIISLIMWILVGVLGVLPATGEIVVSWGGEKRFPLYFGIFTTRQVQEFMGITWIRNQGFFTEGPMYNLVLLIAICIEAFIAPLNLQKGKFIWNGMNLRKILILVITDITTFTITGMILLVAIIALKYCLMQSKSHLRAILKWAGAIVVMIFATIAVNYLFLIKAGTGSWEVRFDDFLAGYKAWHDNLWFGNGYDTMDAITRHMSSLRTYNMGYSSGMFSILAQGGIALLINYIVGFGGYIKYSASIHRYEIVSMLIIIIMILVTSIFHYTFIMMLLLAYGYALLADRTIQRI